MQFLQFIGINFPNVNEDHVREFATHVKTFAQNVSDTHDQATSTVHQLGEAYQGSSYEALIAKWADMSSSHMHDLLEACTVVADALDVAADAIVAMKTEAIAELVVLAASFVADQAAAVATFGLAEAALPALEEAGERIVDFLEQQLEQYIIGKVIEAAVKPLMDTVSKAVQGLAFNATESILGTSAATGSAATFGIDPDTVTSHATTMKGHADTIAGHGQTLADNLSSLSFTT